MRGHLYRQFKAPALPDLSLPEVRLPTLRNASDGVAAAARALKAAERPVIVVGAQTMVGVRDPERLARALHDLGAPVYLAGGANGLLGRTDALQFRHARSPALKEADCVVVCGFPFDFRLGYGRHVRRSATLIAANRSRKDANMNRWPTIAAIGDAGATLQALAQRTAGKPARTEWLAELAARDAAREVEIDRQAQESGEHVNPVAFFRMMDAAMGEDAVGVADGL